MKATALYNKLDPYSIAEQRKEQQNVSTLKKMKAIQDTIQIDNAFDLSSTQKGSEFEPYVAPPKKKVIPDTCVTEMLKNSPVARRIAEKEVSKATGSLKTAKGEVNKMAYKRIPVSSGVLQALRDKLPQDFSNWQRGDKIAVLSTGLQLMGIFFLVNALIKRRK